MKKINYLNSLLLVIAAFIWGTAFVAQSAAMAYIQPMTFNCLRNILGSLSLIVLLKVTKKSLDFSDKNLIKGGILCGLVLFVASTLQQYGMINCEASKAGFLTSLYMLFVPILGIFLGRKISAKVIICMIFGITGMYFLSIKDNFSIEIGDLLVISCSFFFACHIMVIDKYSPLVDGVKLSCLQFAVVACLSFLPMVFMEKPMVSDVLAAWTGLGYAGIFSSGIAYTLQIIGQKNNDPAISSLLMSLESVFAAIGGMLILHEVFTNREALGSIIIFAAVILSQLPDKKAKQD